MNLEDLGSGLYRLTARYGFMEDPAVPEVLRLAGRRGPDVDLMRTTF